MIENIKTIGQIVRQFFRDYFLPAPCEPDPTPAAPEEPAPTIKAPEGERFSR